MNAEAKDVPEYEDPQAPLKRALKLGSGALVVLTIVSLAAWGAARDLPGIWGVLLGAAIGGSFVLLTVVSVLATANTTPSTTMAVVLGSWLVKLLVLIGLLMWLRTMDFYDTPALAVTMIAALVVVLATEVWGIMTTQAMYVG
ncbi:hypothetical protein [Corynebacterium appendicis]|uniref:hypothetical protein n=1 Tax=Corynebacterium appendicis TaxID=163202 RepID=UPI00223B8741|nr:hypothetical protein [Corynebacterium appendicis]MCT1683714.1 hypothetical protein [Corynebacterium appendicis]MDK8624807.1 hypothetical protein [Corynebacterium appendicis]